MEYDEHDEPEMTQFMQFYEDHKDLKVYRTEWMIYSESLRLTGSVDIVFKNDDGTVSLGDWKRSKEIHYKSYGNKCGQYPFEHLPDCNYYHYSLQLNLYRVILEKFYDIDVKDMFLIICHPDNKDGNYIKIPVNRMTKESEYLLDYRKQQLIDLKYPRELFDNLALTHTLETERDEVEYKRLL